ncbi:hypothetical protein ACRN9Z_15960 [Shewanella frigidimarina]|uniref:Uncharacterized protein n=1 Tax=Shewanella morhuae TaxID=365591 RepID=A0A380C019_9GAMM|nr:MULTISPECIES: hypothetical protein [Shewanella]MBB1321097.1 hypothetical protein [Shewanella sp. SR43-8]MBB1364529.1 hypothetical protein [Shewanella sp. SR44-4]MCS6160759.1 hypothetical protein [Shewanella baltica]UJL41130.1 hypothetical protein KDH10_002045 [Shewanella vesiculosa]SUJ09599.1 Uncharacterised protein [Shewanella morhuae]
MKKHGSAKGILKDIKIDGSLNDDESLLFAIDEDCEIAEIVHRRRDQEEIEIGIDDL